MSSVHALPHRWIGSFLLVALGFLLAVIIHESTKERKPELDTSRAAEMVDAIVNRNKAPKLVKWRGDFPSWAALFPEDHDWKEEDRVGEALGKLKKDRSEEVWEELVRRSDDLSYCRTVTSVNTGTAFIDDVGTVCIRLAYSRLTGVYEQHLPPNPFKDGQRLSLDVGIEPLRTWRKQRARKSLYQLQIEVCEKAIEALAKVEGVPQFQQHKSREEIKAEIANLKRTRQPVDVEDDLEFEEGGKYNADLAKRVRDGIKTGKYGDLGIAPK
jgi:hypothetical protein